MFVKRSFTETIKKLNDHVHKYSFKNRHFKNKKYDYNLGYFEISIRTRYVYAC